MVGCKQAWSPSTLDIAYGSLDEFGDFKPYPLCNELGYSIPSASFRTTPP